MLPWPVLWVASIAVFLVSLDTTMLLVAFPTLRAASAGASPAEPSWVLNADLFAALNIKAGTVIGDVHRQRRSVKFRHFLATVDRATDAEVEAHMVLDDSSTHKTTPIKRWLLRYPRVHWHFTPTSASWLNLMECGFSVLTARQLKRGRCRSTQALGAAIGK